MPINLQDASFPDKIKMCHRTGFTRSCRELLDEKVCQGRWTFVSGTDLQKGGDFQGYGCVDDVQYLLQQSFEYRLVGVQAAVEGRGDKNLAASLQISEDVKALAKITTNIALLEHQQHHEAIEVFNAQRGTPQLQSQSVDDEPKQLEFEELTH